MVSNRTGHSSPQNRKITIKFQKANICPAFLSYCSCHLKFLLFFSLKSGVLSSSFLLLGSTVSTTWGLFLHPVFSPPPPSFFYSQTENMLSECEARTALHCPIIEGQLTYSAICRHRMEKEMATHSSTLAWKIPWTEEPGRLQFMGLLRVEHVWATSLSFFTFMRWRRKWQPTPVFLPRESQGWRSLVGCHLWGLTESVTTEAT